MWRFRTDFGRAEPRAVALALVLSAGLLGVATCTAPGAGDIDAGVGDVIDGRQIDAEPDATPPENRANTLFQTSGGGAAASANYRVQLGMGAPQPAGAATSASYGVRLGPNAP